MFGDVDLLKTSFVDAEASFSIVIFGDGLPNIPPYVNWTFTIASAKFEIKRVALLEFPHSLLVDLRTRSTTAPTLKPIVNLSIGWALTAMLRGL